MVRAIYRYEPDYAVPPGWVLEERLEAHEISHAEFARRCGRSPKLISEIIAGKAPIEPKTAVQFERVLGVDAGIWLGIESDYRLRQEREFEARKAEESVEWAKGFPIAELVRRGVMAKPSSGADRVEKLLSFFGVASVEAWRAKYTSAQVAYRHSPSFSSDEPALTTWLRLGEIQAEQAEATDYSAAKFRRALAHIRESTASRSSAAVTDAFKLCLGSGVVLTIVKPLPRTSLSGAARWLTPRKALIQLSVRGMSDDHLWFSFFHEAAHLLLHSKKVVFIHEAKGKITDEDAQADTWASNFLVSPRAWEDFTTTSPLSERSVVRFAEDQGIAPGIVVGRLQYEGKLPWNRLNDMKACLEWVASTSD